MKTSSPSRKNSARKPSHLGSKIQPSPGGSSPTRFASIGRTGGLTARFMSGPAIISRTSVRGHRTMRDDDWNPILSPLRGANDASHKSAESAPQKPVHTGSPASELVRLPPGSFRSLGSESGASDKSHEKSDP